MEHVLSITAVTEVFGDGQKTTAVEIAYDVQLTRAAISAQAFRVEGRTITGVTVEGNVVTLALNPQDPGTMNTRQTERGPRGKLVIDTPELSVQQVAGLEAESGRLAPWSEAEGNTAVKNLIVDEFRLFEFPVPGTDRVLQYNLFIPKDYDADKRYPLVLFIPDAGARSDDYRAPLAQGLGGVIWASPEEQAKHPCFVLAPYYTTKAVNDDYETTWEVDATPLLVRHIAAQYSIDAHRIYGTGQSMGCMMLCELNARYDDLFGACLLVAGQWNPAVMGKAKDHNLWIVVSEGDGKAFPGMNAVTAAMEAAGGKVSRSPLNAKASQAEIRAVVERVAGMGNPVNYTWLEGDSVLVEGAPVTPGSFHGGTWRVVYTFEALRDWLFAQRKA